jgi:signal transduction histidine kinase/PAS domain-containing protein
MTAIASSRRIQGCAIALAVALLGLTGWSVLDARRAALEQAGVDSRNLARALQEHTLQAFQAVDLVLRGLADRLGTVDPAAMPAILTRQSAGLGQIRAMSVLDAQGVRIAASGGLPSGTTADADLDYFTAQRAQPALGLYIGPPVRRPDDGRWVVPMSRRLDGPQGEFAGVVMAALDASYFQDFYDRVEVGPHGAIVLFGTDGTLYFRKPYDAANVGLKLLDRPAFRERLLRYPSGTFETTPSLDGITRISSHRQLGAYPFVVVVGLAKDDVLAQWRHQAAIHLSAAAALALALVGLGGLLGREVRRRAAAEAEARRAADGFHRDKVLLEAVLNAMPDAIVLLDQRGDMLLWNDLLFQVLELERAAIVEAADPTAALAQALAARGDRALALRDLAPVPVGAPVGASVEELRLASGKWIECRMTHVRGLGCIAIYRDIAERKHREIEMVQSQARLQAQTADLAQLAEDLDLARQTAEAARIEAETASRTKSSFITGMNHELRTPLTAILGFAQVIRDQRFGTDALPRYSEYAGHIISSGEHLLALINDLLDLAKIEAGKMDLEPQPVDLKQLLAATILMVKETAASGRITIDLSAPDESILLPGDPRRLKQCFLNLVSNAVKFTPEGGHVGVMVTPTRDSVEVAVVDTGIGVKPSDIAKIFEPFGQIDSALARRHVGTGLGLPLARSLVEMHGGDLSFHSVEGAGTTVTVSLPRQRLVA